MRAMLCDVCVCPSFLFTLKYSLWNRATVNAFQCYRQHNSWMFWVREKEPKHEKWTHTMHKMRNEEEQEWESERTGINSFVAALKMRTAIRTAWMCHHFSSVASTLSRSCSCIHVRSKADSRSLTGLILQRVMKERTNDSFLTSISFAIFFHHFLVFSFPHHDNMLPFSFTPLNPLMQTEKMVWNKNYIFYVDVSLPQCSSSSGVRA